MPRGTWMLRSLMSDGTLSVTSARAANVGPGLSDFSNKIRNLTLAMPLDACSPLTNGPDVAGSIALIRRGSCGFSWKIAEAQRNGAIAVVMYNNIDGYFRIVNDASGVRINIPSVSITKQGGEELLKYALDNTTSIEAVISNDNENSLRVAFDAHTLPGTVAGTIEARVNNRGYDVINEYEYGKFRFTGTYDQQTGRLVLTPGMWLVEPGTQGTNFGLVGSVKTLGGLAVLTGTDLPPLSAPFHLHEAIDNCVTIPNNVPGAQCGTVWCALAIDSKGYTVFNDHECEGSLPLRWYCEQDGLAGTCQGERLHSADLPGNCSSPGQELNSFWNYFPADQSVSSLSVPGITVSTHCQLRWGGPCSNNDGWEMRGAYMWSGGPTSHNSNSFLTLVIDIGPTGGELKFNFKTDGEVRYDYLTVAANGTIVYRTLYYNLPLWTMYSYELPPGRTTMQLYWRKDGSVSSGADGVFVRGLAVTGSVGQACTSCPAGTCSGPNVATCRECEVGTYSSAGSDSCAPCTNPLPDFARYASGSASSTCEWTCMDGYRASNNACVPKPQTCLLPATPVPPEVRGSTYISYAMLQQCLMMTPYNATAGTQTMNTLRELASLYPNAQWQQSVNLKPDLNIFLNSYPPNTPTSDWEFHRQLSLNIRLYNDPDLLYTPPTFYQRIEMFLPLHMTTLVVPNENNRQGIFIDGVNSIAAFFGYLRPATDRNWDANDYYGWEVVEIDNVDAMAAISQFANNNEVGVSPSPETRFNLALNSKLANETDQWLYWTNGYTQDNQGQFPVGAPQVNAGQWSCTFTQRNLGLCGTPSNPTVTLKLRQSSRAAPIIVEVPWSIVYLGWNTVDVSPTSSNSMEELLTHRNPVEPYNCSDNMMDLMSRPTARFWPDVPPANADFSRNKMTPVSGGVLELLNAHRTVSVFLFYPTGSAEVIGVLELRQLQYEEFAIHSAITDLVSKNVTRVMLDVRGNIGGSECHAEELAYLLANVSQVPFGRAAVQLRQSDLMRRTVTNQAAQAPGMRDFLSLAPQKFATYDSEEGLLQLGDDSFYRNGVMVPIGGTSVPFSRRVQRVCRASDSILSFVASDTCAAQNEGYWLPEVGENYMQLLRLTKNVNWRPALSIVSDGRCAGACATFVRILQSLGGVHTVGFGALAVPASIGGGALTSSDAQLQCAWRAGGMENSRQLYLPWEGQTLRLPIAAGFVGADVNNPSARPALFESNGPATQQSWVDRLDSLGRLRQWTGRVIAAWPMVVPSFSYCESPNLQRDCRVEFGSGRQVCKRDDDSGDLRFTACRAVSCDPGYFRTATEPPTCELAISSAKAIEAMLGQDNVQAALLRREIAYFLMNEAPDSGGLKSSGGGGGGGGGGWKSGAVGGLAFGMLLVGMILAMILALAVHMRAPALLASLPGNIMGRLQDLRWENRGGGGSGRHIVTTPAPVNIPLDVEADEGSTSPPAAQGKSGFLANLQTRKSRESVGDDTDERPMLSESADDDDKL